MASPARSLEYEFEWAPSPSTTTTTTTSNPKQSASKIIDNLSPPIIAMFAVAGTAFLIVVYVRLLSRQIILLRRRWRRWRRCRHLLRSAASDFGSGSGSGSSGSHFSPPDSYSDHLLISSPYGLDDAAIKTLPLSLFSRSKAKQPISTNRDCAVCLFEFDDGEWLRTLPICGHGFHIECIDVWLKSHPTCPLCRSSVVSFRSDSPFVPMRAARIRPSFDDIVVLVDPPPSSSSPILEERERERERGRGFLLKRSYSFGFERSVGTERMVMTASPAWRIRHHQQNHHHSQNRGFWSKRWASPFGGGGSARPYYNHRSGGGGTMMKSPFGRRWGIVGGGGAVGSSAGRRSRSMTSPSAMWMGRAVGFSSSRMRCGDPEALLSPERFNRR